MINSLKHFLSIVLPLTLLTPQLYGGTGAGNEFEHFVNYEFDFHIAKPLDWTCANCQGAPMQETVHSEDTWKLAAPEGSTWLEVTFITNFPAVTEAELRTEIESRHPGWQWHDIHRADDAFIGFSNSPQLDDANAATEYYLVKKNMVVSLAWQKDSQQPTRALQLDLIKKTIDRVSSPIKINSIKSESMNTVKPGDRACWTVEVDDLRSKFVDASVETFELKGTVAHFSFKSIKWVPEKNWFHICQHVPTSAGTDGLKVASLSISDDARGVNCDLDETGPKLSCHFSSVDLTGSGNEYTVPMTTAAIDNPAPDTSGPEFQSVTFNAEKQQLIIQATDVTGLHMGSVTTKNGMIILYPDQLRPSVPVSLAEISLPGWNVITQIILYDSNGLPTVLTAPKTLQKYRKASNIFYQINRWNGTRHESTIPVIAWLQDRRKI